MSFILSQENKNIQLKRQATKSLFFI